MTKQKIPSSVIRCDSVIYETLISRKLYATADQLMAEGHVDVDLYIPRHCMSVFERSIFGLFENRGGNIDKFRELVKLTKRQYTDVGVDSSRLNVSIARSLLYVNDTTIERFKTAFEELERYEATAKMRIRMSAVQSYVGLPCNSLMCQDKVHYLGESYIEMLRRHLMDDSSHIYNFVIGCTPMEDDLTI